jgi:thiol:disulfide interchange protein
MARKYSLIAVLMLSVISVSAQIYDPVTWDFGYEKTGDRQYELIFTANIESNSHIYAMNIPEGGPIPTSFSFDTLPAYKLDGEPYEVTKPTEKFDEAFGFKIKTFSNKAEFRQKIYSDQPFFTVKGVVNFMACNNATCSPPKDVEFSISVGEPGSRESTIVQGSTGKDQLQDKPGRGLLKFFLISLLAGFAGVLTPCVFPMIPMTVAFFSQGSAERRKAITRAVIFGLSIVFIYSSIGIIVSLTSAGAGFANTLSTNWIINVIFFALFVIFASSFFGAFEIVLPNKWVEGADSRVDRGGVLAVFFMGLTTVIVSFSCTGPIIGALLVEAASGDVLRPTLGMLGFGIAFALPFTIFALFPSVMSRLPKSGGWLNSVKVVLGFIMLAFSMKFLMTIDSVYSLGILSRDVFLAIWIVLFSLLGLYLMGKIKFRHDNDLKHIGIFRFLLIVATFSFVVYLIPGLFGSPLTGISYFLPSPNTTELNLYNMITEASYAPAADRQDEKTGTLCSVPKYNDIFDMPYGLKGYYDYNQGLECASEQGKPVLLDFKGHACANCKLMEARVWSDPGVLKLLREEFIIVSLYADDRTPLPQNEWITSSVDGKVKKTLGKVNEDLEISKFKTNALPLYVITDSQGNALVEPMPTNLNVEEYRQWLKEGIEAFKKIN